MLSYVLECADIEVASVRCMNGLSGSRRTMIILKINSLKIVGLKKKKQVLRPKSRVERGKNPQFLVLLWLDPTDFTRILN